MSKITAIFPLVTVFTFSLVLLGCGNKGDLIRESDQAALEELEQEAEKLKKEKKEASQAAE